MDMVIPDDAPVMNFEDMLAYIKEITGLTEDTILKVLDAETDFMCRIGLAEAIPYGE